MNKRVFLLLLTTIFGVYLTRLPHVSAEQETCPEGNGWTKIDSDDLSQYPVSGATQYCFKAGSTNSRGCNGGIFNSWPQPAGTCGLSHWSYFIPSVTPTPTTIPTPTNTPAATPTPTPTTAITPTNTPTPTDNPQATPTPTIKITPTVTPSPTDDPGTTPVPTPTVTITVTPSPTPTPTNAPGPTATPTPESSNGNSSTIDTGTGGGQVLGVTTLASTSSSHGSLKSLISLTGTIFVAAGLRLRKLNT